MNTVRRLYEESAQWFVKDDEGRTFVNDLGIGRTEVNLIPVEHVYCTRERDAIEGARHMNLNRPRYENATGYIYIERLPMASGYEYNPYVETWT